MDGITPVSVAFGEGGVLVTSIMNGKPFVRTLTWKELYKMGLKGKPLDQGVFLKKLSAKVEEFVQRNKESDASHKKHMAEMKAVRRRLTQSRPSLPPSAPLPPTAVAP